jgi:hypothetical protein
MEQNNFSSMRVSLPEGGQRCPHVSGQPGPAQGMPDVAAQLGGGQMKSGMT